MNMAKFCANCGAPRKDDAKFCKECGQPLSQTIITPATDISERAEEPVAVNDSATTTEVMDLSESTTLIETPALIDDLTPALSERNQPFMSFSKLITKTINPRTKKPFLYAAVLVGILLISVIGWSIFVSGSSHPSAPLVYIKDYEMMLKSGKQDSPSSATRNWLNIDDESGEGPDFGSSDDASSMWETAFYTFGDQLQYVIKLNERGDRMFYLNQISDDGTANLYYSNPTKVVKAGDESTDLGVRIASNLTVDQYKTFLIPKSGDYVLYLKNYDSTTGGSLYLYNMKEEILIDKNVSSNYSLSEDELSIIYMKTPDDETYDLYTKKVDSKVEKVKIDSDVNQIIDYSSDLKTIYYTKSNEVDSEDPDYNYYTLYVKQDGQDKKKLISDYSDLESSSTSGQFFFTRTSVDSRKLIDFVDDNMAAGDLKITEPVYSDYEYEDTYTDYWGYTYTNTEVDYDKYYAATDLYTAKLDRDSLRSDLKNEELSTTTTQLYLYDNGKEVEITKEFSHSLYANAASKSIIFVKTIEDQISKIKLSEINDAYEVKEQFENSTNESTNSYIVLNGTPEKEMSEQATGAYNFNFSADGKQLYCKEQDGDTSSLLVVWDVLENKLSNRKLIDENVDEYIIVDDTLWYYKDVKDGQGELLSYNAGQKVKIAYDVQVGNSTFYPEDNVLLYMTDFNEKRITGSLFMMRGDNSIKISDEVNFYNYNKETDLFYVSDYRLKNGEGDLWEYRGKDKKKLIDSAVQTMLPIKQGLSF